MTEIASLYHFFEAFPDEQSAIDHLRGIRWKNGAYCPYCASKRIMHFSDKRTHKCHDCRRRFSIKVGTIFEDSKLPLRKWMAAIWMLTSHRKGVASTQLARDLKITQKAAWFMLHRLRYAAKTRSFNRPLEGTVEVDESYFGGREKNKHASKRKHEGTGGIGKVAVLGMLERGGEMRAKKISAVDGFRVAGRIYDNVREKATLMTDEHAVYRRLKGQYQVYSVDHGSGEFVRGHVHINTIEGAWSLFKRQVIGIHHHISEKHIDAYLSEMCYRYSRREMDEGVRVNDLLTRVDGRLTYKALINAPQTGTLQRETND